jgi:hypothetical protein
MPRGFKSGFSGHVAGKIRCSCSICRSSIRQRFGKASSIRFCSARTSGYEKKNMSSVVCATRQSLSLNHIGRQTPTPGQPKCHSLNLARRDNDRDAPRADMPLRTEQVSSFADVCCANPKIADCSATKPGSWRVMPAGYIEPKNIVFHHRRLLHEVRGMNQLQESREHSQISPRKVTRTPAKFKNSTNRNNEGR